LYKNEHPELAESLNNIGVTYGNLNDNEKSLEYHLKAYEMRARLQKSEQLDLAQSLYNIGFTHKNMNQHQKALEYLLKAYDMQNKIYSEDNPLLLLTASNIINCYFNLEKPN
jgi:tetratricopeptide (TPR) repeat protein